MNTGNETAPVHIDAFICTLTLLIRTSCLIVVFVVVAVFFFTVKNKEEEAPSSSHALTAS